MRERLIEIPLKPARIIASVLAATALGQAVHVHAASEPSPCSGRKAVATVTHTPAQLARFWDTPKDLGKPGIEWGNVMYYGDGTTDGKPTVLDLPEGTTGYTSNGDHYKGPTTTRPIKGLKLQCAKGEDASAQKPAPKREAPTVSQTTAPETPDGSAQQQQLTPDVGPTPKTVEPLPAQPATQPKLDYQGPQSPTATVWVDKGDGTAAPIVILLPNQ